MRQHSSCLRKICTFCSAVLHRPGFFLVISAAGQAIGPSVDCDLCLNPSRAPWRVL